MIHFGSISRKQFLQDYWQKKPLLIKNALPNFICPLSPDELAGLSCEEEFESRIITGSIKNNLWSLNNGPFNEDIFSKLPENDWTLLVQGVDRYISNIYNLINEFDFIPRWRFDDIMISFASMGGGVGPHYDHYDVFLLQGLGSRKWLISTKDCSPDNYLNNTPLRIMETFHEEVVWVAEPGDIVYIPPKVAHHGISLDKECITLSIGYRSYSAQEMAEQLNLTRNKKLEEYFVDPIWTSNLQPAEIPQIVIEQAKSFLNIDYLSEEQIGCFITKLDSEDERRLNDFINYEINEKLEFGTTYSLNPLCRIAYQHLKNKLMVFINGEVFKCSNINEQTVIDFCNKRQLKVNHKNHIFAEQLMALSFIKENI
tara:strand:- start:29 stop:1138 length:1110 start_codon:yes stop_codon:yes gene_type:complete